MRFQHWLQALPSKLLSLFHRKQADQEVRDEIRDHIESQIEEYLAQGMSPEEARTAALRQLGGITQVEEQCREQRRLNLVWREPEPARTRASDGPWSDDG